MKKIVVIGNSIAGVKALETIRGFDTECSLTIFALDGFYPYNRDLFADYFLKKIKESKLSYKPKEFYEQSRINVILERQISRVNFKNKRIFTQEKDQIDFDVLIIVDTHQVKFPDIKGTGKTGVFALRKLSDLKKMITAFPLIETVVIETNSPQGLRMADAFKKTGKEVIVLDNSVAEILGDAEVKAIRLKSGKVLAAEMVIFAETPPDLRVFNETGLETGERIWVDSSFKTNLEGVFALDHAAQFKEESLRSYLKTSRNLSFPNALVGNPDEAIIRPPTETFGGDNFEISYFDPTSTSYLEEAGKTVASNIAGLNKMNVLTILSKDDAHWAEKALKAEKAGYIGKKESSKFSVENRKYM